MSTNWAIRIPKEGGGEEFVTRVDVSRLHPRIVSEIYQLIADRLGGPKTWKRAHGIEALVKADDTRLDVSSLEEMEKDLKDQCRVLFKTFGEAGQTAITEIVDEIRLGELCDAISMRDTQKAQEIIEFFFHSVIMGQYSRLMERIQDAERTATHLKEELAERDAKLSVAQEAANQAHEIAVKGFEVGDQLYAEWAEAAYDLTCAVKAIDDMERDLRQSLKLMEDAFRKLMASIAEVHPTLHEAVQFLDRGDHDFVSQAYAFTYDPSSVPNIDALVCRAKDFINKCATQEQDAHKRWLNLKGYYNQNVAAKEQDIRAQLGMLHTNVKKMQDSERRFGQEAVRPWAVANPIIDKDTYEHAKRLVSDPKWAPITTKQRLEGLIFTLSKLLGQEPKLPMPVTRAITAAQEHIKLVENARADSAMSPTETHATPLVNKGNPAPDSQETTETVSENEQRVEELYELIQCVGCVLTASKHHFSASTINSMLGTVVYLGLATEKELRDYGEAIRTRSRLSGEREALDSWRNVADRWQNSPAKWLVYTNSRGRAGMLKLSYGASQNAETLCAKHNLSRDHIRQAYNKKRADSAIQRKQRVANSSRGAEDSDDD